MSRARKILMILLLLAAAGGAAYALRGNSSTLMLTGIVTTHEVIVSPQIGGQLTKLLVQEGDTVEKDQLLALIAPDELQADRNYYEHNVETMASQTKESEAALRYQERQTADQINQAEAMVASAIAQQAEAVAGLENAQRTFERTQELAKQGVAAAQQLDTARADLDSAKARLDSAQRQIEAQKAAAALARSSAEQIAVKRSQLYTSEHQRAAAQAQQSKADVRLKYTEVRAPIAGVVDVRAARPGEVVSAAQPIVTLINLDDLWVRTDVEETYIERIRVGDKLQVRLPSGDERTGTVSFRGVDAGFATQRDVSRSKRDIKTFEVRLRVDNTDRRLAVGMTAYILAPLGGA